MSQKHHRPEGRSAEPAAQQQGDIERDAAPSNGALAQELDRTTPPRAGLPELARGEAQSLLALRLSVTTAALMDLLAQKQAALERVSERQLRLSPLLFDLVLGLAAPGIGKAVGRVAAEVGARASDEVLAQASAGIERVVATEAFWKTVESGAPALVGQGLSVAKRCAKAAVFTTDGQTGAAAYLEAVSQAMRVGLDDLMLSSGTLDDATLVALAAQFDPNALTLSVLRARVEQVFQCYQRGVEDISGPQDRTLTLEKVLGLQQGDSESRFLARCAFEDSDGPAHRYVVVEGMHLDRAGRLHELVQPGLVDAAKLAHAEEWNGAPVPEFMFYGGGRVGPK